MIYLYSFPFSRPLTTGRIGFAVKNTGLPIGDTPEKGTASVTLPVEYTNVEDESFAYISIWYATIFERPFTCHVATNGSVASIVPEPIPLKLDGTIFVG